MQHKLVTTLFIDTSRKEEVHIVLTHEGRKYSAKEAMNRTKAQVTLPLILSLLKKQGLTLHALDAIEVATGPGSFTGLRVGVSIANTLSLLLKIPLNGMKSGSLVEPTY